MRSPLTATIDVARLDAGGAAGDPDCGLGDERALGLLEAEAVGDFRSTGWICTPIQPRVTVPFSFS